MPRNRPPTLLLVLLITVATTGIALTNAYSLMRCRISCGYSQSSYSPCNINGVGGIQCICPPTDFEYGSVCLTRSRLYPSVQCPAYIGECRTGASCYTISGRHMCICKPEYYQYNGACYSIATNELAVDVSSGGGVDVSTVACDVATDCVVSLPTQRCYAASLTGTSVCVCPTSHFLVGSSCVARTELKAATKSRVCSNCVDNSICYTFVGRHVCICVPGFFAFSGACHPLVPKVVTTLAPVTAPLTARVTTIPTMAPTMAPTMPTTMPPTMPPTQAPFTGVPLRCKRWPVPGHGILLEELVFMTGDIIFFACSVNRVLLGPPKSRCMEDGQFQEVYPMCVRDPTLPPDESEEKVTDPIVTYEIKTTTAAPPVITAAPTTTTAVPTTPYIHVQCPAPTVIAGGVAFGKDLYEIGEAVQLNCLVGHVRLGEDLTICQADGTFNVVSTICAPVLCPVPEIAHGVEPEFSQFEFDFIFTFACQVGYVLSGPATTRCTISGEFETTDSACSPVICPVPTIPENGVPTDVVSFVFGDVFTFQCQDGYILSGAAATLCDPNGSFETADTVCSPVSCPTPDVPEFGVIPAQLTFILGDVFTFQCQYGYKVAGATSATCASDGLFGVTDTACVAVTCSAPAIPENAVGADLISFAYGAIFTFQCQDGYILYGAEITTCNGDGSFTPTDTVCSPVPCPVPATLEFGVTITIVDAFVFGDVLFFECQAGYATSGAPSTTCGSDGTFATTDTVCVPGACSAPTIPEFGVNPLANSYVVGDVFMFECQNGYILSGAETATCGVDGLFPPTDTVCSIVNCLAPTIPAYAVGTDVVFFVFGDVFTFQCQEGYFLSGPASTTCLSNGMFTETDTHCLPVNCPTPTIPQFGVAADGLSFVFGDVFYFECQAGYTLTNADSTTCGSDGVFPTTDTICVPRRCPAPTIPAFALGTDVVSFVFGDVFDFQCQEGYILRGAASTICWLNGLFMTSDTVCEPVTCPTPATPEFALAITNFAAFVFGDVVNFECQSGYTLSGPPSTTCLSDGTFATTDTVCAPVTCPAPATPEFALNITNVVAFVFGDVVYFECQSGYTLSGASSTTCLSDGTFSRTHTICLPITCPAPATPEFALTITNFVEFVFGDVVNFECQSGYTLSGASSTTCLSDGTFARTRTICLPVTCPAPSIQFGVTITNFAAFVFGDVFHFKCQSGYILFGAPSTTCGSDGTFARTDAACLPVTCPAPSIQFGVTITNFAAFVFGDVFHFKCQSGYALSGAASTTCGSDGLFRATDTVCAPVTCPAPSIKFGVTITNFAAFVFGDVIYFRCQSGYAVSGPTTTSCGADGTFATTDTFCAPVTCPAPTLKNGVTITNIAAFIFGDVVYLQCQSGYTLSGAPSTTCGSDGTFARTDTVCLPVTCPAPATPEFGVTITNIAAFLFGDVFYFECQKGYAIVGATSTTCGSDRTFATTDTVCVPGSCPPPATPRFGVTPLGNSFVFGDVFTFRCQEGYRLSGTPVTICGAEGTFAPTDTVCTLVTCPAPTIPEFAVGTDVVSFVFGDVFNFQCQEGYLLSGPESTICGSDGVFGDSSTACLPVPCTAPTIKLGVPITNLAEFVFGDVFYFGCQHGYTVSGAPSTTCGSDGTFAPTDTFCAPVTCPAPTIPAFGVATADVVSFVFGDVLYFQCQPGYVLLGPITTSCRADGKFATTGTVCLPVQCAAPVLPDHAVELTSAVYNFNDELVIACQSGFKVFGGSTLICQANGKFSTSITACVPVQCAAPVLPADAVELTPAVYGVNDEVMIACRSGFELVGDSIITCQTNGQFSSSITFCAPVQCSAPVLPADAVELTSAVYGVSDEVVIVCQSGFELIGDSIITCQTNGQFSSSIAFCSPVQCAAPVLPAGAIELTPAVYGVNDEVVIVCQPGFELVGDSIITCQTNGQFSSSIALCDRVRCAAPVLPAGAVELASTAIYGVNDEVVIVCQKGFLLVGDSTITCQANGQFSSPITLCAPVPCAAPVLPAGAVELTSAVYNFNDEVVIACQPGFALLGDSIITCQANGKFSSASTLCTPVYCAAPVLPAGAIELTSAVYNVNDEVVIVCQPGFVLIGDSIITCHANGQFSSSITLCSPVVCGPPKIPENGIRTDVAVFEYGDVFRFECQSGHVRTGKPTTRCGHGSRFEETNTSCRKVRCPAPTIPAYAVRTDVVSFVYGDVFTFQCQEGYILSRTPSTSCGADGIFAPTDTVCYPVQCPTPSAPDNGLEFEQDFYMFNEQIQFRCLVGYVLVGEASAVCQENGFFTTAPAFCAPVICLAPTIPDNGVPASKSMFEYGDVVTFECQPGFVLTGAQSASCGADETFGQIDTACTLLLCNSPMLLQHGAAFDKEQYSPGEVANYKCEAGFRLMGNAAVTCMTTGEFTQTLVGCTPVITTTVPTTTTTTTKAPTIAAAPVPCRAPARLANGGGFNKAVYLHKELVELTCAPGFALEGYPLIVCQENGMFSTTSAVCKKLPGRCIPGAKTANGVGFDKAKYSYGEVAQLTCDDGFVLMGSSQATCLPSGKFSLILAICAPVTCKPEKLGSGLVMDKKSYNVGEVAKISCKAGLVLIGNNRAVCFSTGIFTPILAVCEPVPTTSTVAATITRAPPAFCTAPPVLENGVAFAKRSYRVGDVAKLRCQVAYTLVGEKFISCLRTGTFSPIVSICAPVICRPPKTPANGVDLDEDAYGHGDMVVFQCQKNFIPGGDLVATCGSDGTFGKVNLICLEVLPVMCPAPTTSANMLEIKKKAYSIGEVINFKCRDGYNVVGEKRAACRSDGTFTDKSPGCAQIVCAPPTPPLFGKKQQKDVYNYGDAIIFGCEEGYAPVGDKSSICGGDGTFGKLNLKCKKVSTSDDSTAKYQCHKSPKMAANTKRLTKQHWKAGEEVDIECLDGYVKLQKEQVFCQKDGSFTSSFIMCLPVLASTTKATTTIKPAVTCSRPHLPEFARPVSQDSFAVGESFVFQCEAGFELIGLATLTCQQNGLFSIAAAVCAPVVCVISSKLKNGEINPNPKQLWDVGSIVDFSCHVGFRLVGEARAQCTHDGSFTSPVPQCRKLDVFCTGFPVLANGEVEPFQFVYDVGVEIKIVCNAGYSINGDRDVVTCQDDGTFGDNFPQCFEDGVVKCDVAYPDNGYAISDKTRYDVNEVVLFECFPGYKMNGLFSAMCQKDGKFTNMPTCKLDQQGSSACKPTPPKNGYVLPGTHGVGSIIFYVCEKGYRMEGLNESICLYGGVIIPGKPRCVGLEENKPKRFTITCTPDQPVNGYVVPKGQTEFPVLSPFEYACEPGYKLSTKLKTRLCSLDKTMVLSAPSCIRK